MVKENCADIIQMPAQSEETSSSLIRPDLNLVIVTSGNEERLCAVEVNAPDWSIVLFEAVNECSHTVIP